MGSVIETRQFDQYVIKMDGSGRVTLRNRKFLRKYIPVKNIDPTKTIDNDIMARKFVMPTQIESHEGKSLNTTASQSPQPGNIRQVDQGHLDIGRTPKQRMTSFPSRFESPLVSDKGQGLTPKRLSFHIETPVNQTTLGLDVPTLETPNTVQNPTGQMIAKPTRQSTRTTQQPKWYLDYDMNSHYYRTIIISYFKVFEHLRKTMTQRLGEIEGCLIVHVLVYNYVLSVSFVIVSDDRDHC